jgi:hypothetical protein
MRPSESLSDTLTKYAYEWSRSRDFFVIKSIGERAVYNIGRGLSELRSSPGSQVADLNGDVISSL